MKIRIDTTLSNEFILQMITLYIEGFFAVDKPSKKYFLIYMRNQIEMFGVDMTSQFGESPLEITDKTREYFKKWFCSK